jgi:hypothetical protein
MCPHLPTCPPADHPDRAAARTVAFHPEQGWTLLCNGVIVFDDLGEILPGGPLLLRTAWRAPGFPRRRDRSTGGACRYLAAAKGSALVAAPG